MFLCHTSFSISSSSSSLNSQEVVEELTELEMSVQRHCESLARADGQSIVNLVQLLRNQLIRRSWFQVSKLGQGIKYVTITWPLFN